MPRRTASDKVLCDNIDFNWLYWFWCRKNDKNPKFKVHDRLRTSKYSNIFAKGYTANCTEEAFVMKNVINSVPWTHATEDLMEKNFLELIMKKNCERQTRV